MSWQSAAEGWAPPKVNVRTPSVGRMYDYYLGGKDNFAADRHTAEQVAAVVPQVWTFARENRAFLGRVVRYLIRQGIRQFIDVGTGLPTQGHVHEVTAELCPDARVVYVDNDPIVLAHARALIAPRADVAVIDADMRRPRSILDHPEARKLIDFTQPAAVLLVAMLHFADGHDDPTAVAGAFTERLANGSYLALSHATSDGPPAHKVQEVEEIYAHTTAPITFRTREQIAALFGDLELVPPGLVYVPQWRPVPGEIRLKRSRWLLGGVARKTT